MTFAVSALTRETHITYTLCRNFHWYECNIWGHDLRKDDVIFVGGEDCILPAADVLDYMSETSPARVVFRKSYHHAQVLFSPALFDMVRIATMTKAKAK